jgi:hypothetical protein
LISEIARVKVERHSSLMLIKNANFLKIKEVAEEFS